MKIAVYSTKQYDKKYLQHVNNAYGFELEFLTSCSPKRPLKPPTAVKRYAFSLTMTVAARYLKN